MTEAGGAGGVSAGRDLSISAQAGAVAAGVIHNLTVHLPEQRVRLRMVEAMPAAATAFQPREAVFVALRDALAAGGAPGLGDARALGGSRTGVAVVTGGRGVGKSQVAAAFCQGCDAQDWPVVVWL